MRMVAVIFGIFVSFKAMDEYTRCKQVQSLYHRVA